MRNIFKLKEIIEDELRNGLTANNVSKEMYEGIIEKYNTNMPKHSRIQNISRNRKMILSNIIRWSKRIRQENNSSKISQIQEFIPSLGKRHVVLNDDEQNAIDVLLNLESIIPDTILLNENVNLNVDEVSNAVVFEDVPLNKMRDSTDIGNIPLMEDMCLEEIVLNFPLEELLPLENGLLSVDEICALEALSSLYDDKDPKPYARENLHSEMHDDDINLSRNHYNTESKPAILTSTNENVQPCLPPEEVTTTKIEKILSNFIYDLKGMLESLSEKFVFSNTINNTNNFSNNSLNKNEVKYKSSKLDNTNLDNLSVCKIESNKHHSIKSDSILNENLPHVLNDSNEDNEYLEIISVGNDKNLTVTCLNETSRNISNNSNKEKDFEKVSIIKDDSSGNVLNASNLTLGPFEISDNSLKLTQFGAYRKTPNPKEKLNRDVIRLKGETTNRSRIFRRNIFDSEFEIDADLIFEAKDDKSLKLSKNKFVLDIIRQEYLKINNACIISFYSTKTTRSGLLAYGYCSFKDCCKYRFKVNFDGKVVVSRCGKMLHAEGEKRVAQIRGVTRKIVKKELNDNSAYLYRKDQILRASDDISKSGNLQNVQNLATLRKCKSEGNSDRWLHADQFYEVFLMQQKMYKDYIQHIASPLTIYCWGKATFITFAANPQILKDASYTIHFDASGQSVRQIECAEKRVLIYKIVIRNKKHKMIIPIVTAILSRHTLNDICGILEKLKLYCIENNFKWSFFQRVCTDVSYALFGAVLKACNDENISEYLLNCYRYLERPSVNKKPKVIVQWCKAHYIQIMCKDLNNKIGKHNFLRRFIKHVLTMAFDLKTLEECKYWFKQLFVLFLLPKKNYLFRESFDILRTNILEDDVIESKIQSNDVDELRSLESIASRSPFKKIFLKIYDDIKNKIRNSKVEGDDNEYKNEEICNFIINKYCPFLPMWTNIMGILIDPSGNHLSNAPVEFSFFLQKHILLKQKSLRPGDFLRIDRKDNISSLKDLRYRYNMFEELQIEDVQRSKLDVSQPEDITSLQVSEDHSSSILTKYQDIGIIKDLLPEEKWNKKDPRKRKAINPKQLLNAKRKIKKFRKQTEIPNIIKIEPDELANTCIKKEHTYCEPSSSFQSKKQKITYYLIRCDDLITSIFPTLKQFEVGFFNFLDQEDWYSLKNDTRLTNLVVDCAILCVIKENSKHVLSLPCQIGEINFERINKLMSFKPEMLFIPILRNGHFNLCVLKQTTKEFIFIDSLNDCNGKSYYNDFTKNVFRNESWKFVEILQRTKQKDLFSCGVFVIMYVICFIKRRPMTNLLPPNVFREEIKKMLFKYADDCSTFCCHCGTSI